MFKLFLSPIIFACITYFLSVYIPVSIVSELVSGHVELNDFGVKSEDNKIAKNKEVQGVADTVTGKGFQAIDFTVREIKKLEFAEKIKKEGMNNKIVFKQIQKVELIEEVIEKPVVGLAEAVVTSDMLVQSIEHSTYELSFNDIEAKAIEVKDEIKKVAWVKFSFPKVMEESSAKIIANTETKKDTNKEDRISTMASAQEKSPSKIVSPISDEPNLDDSSDELVFFNLTEDGKVITENESLAESPRISEPELDMNSNMDSVAIAPVSTPEKFITTSVPVKVTTPKTIKPRAVAQVNRPKKASDSRMAFVEPDRIVQDKRNPFLGDDIKTLESDYACLNDSAMKREQYNNEYSVSLRSVKLGQAKFDKVYNFDIRFPDDLDDIVQDFGRGEARLSYNLNTNMNIRRGVLSSRNHYPTVVDFVFEGVDTQYSIPLFEVDKFNALVSEVGVPALGSQVLVELDEQTEDVELDVDTKYDAKIFLDASLNIVDRAEADFSYIMFLGVPSGNTIINFRNIHGKTTNKIIYLSPKDIYYEPNFYAKEPSDQIKLYEEGLRSKCIGMLDIDKDKIHPWSYAGKVTKESLNTHTISEMIYPLGARKYFDFTHFEKNIFVGRWSEENIVLPTKEYANNILNEFEIEHEECMVQINLVKSIADIKVSGLSETGYMNTDVRFLDENGNFYRDVSSKTNRVFIAGEEQGLLNLKLEYGDGSFQYLQTYCSKNTYLVEQL